MTPGEAAVMNTSVGRAAATPARRCAMSRSGAARSFHSMGPVHAGRDTVERPTRAAAAGKSAQSARWARAVPPNPVIRWRT